MRSALSVFERYGVSIEHLPTGVDSFGIVVNSADVKDKIYPIITDIRREVAPDDITVTDKLALISIVGRNLRRRPGSSGLIFGVLGKAGINIRLITQSSQEISIIVGVDNDDFERAIRVMYDGFAAHEKV